MEENRFFLQKYSRLHIASLTGGASHPYSLEKEKEGSSSVTKPGKALSGQVMRVKILSDVMWGSQTLHVT